MHIFTLGAMFAVMLVFNILTQMLSDDFLYAFSIADNQRLSSVAATVESVIAHGKWVNGRYFAHFFAQFFLMFDGIVFDLVNSAVFVATVYLIYHTCNRGRETNNLFLIGIFGSFWLFQHKFGQVYLWLDGACNYLFATFFATLYLLPFLNLLLRKQQPRPIVLLWHLPLSVLLGGYLEPLSVGAVFAACLFVSAELFYFKNKRALWFVPSLLGSFFGLALMAFAPAEKMNKLSGFSLLKILEVFGTGLLVLASLFPVILLFVVCFRRLQKENSDPRLLLSALILAAGALASNFILLIANNYPLRCSVGCVFLSIFATALLYGNLKDRTFGSKARFCGRLLGVALSLALTLGLADTVATYVCIRQNERIIAQALENGETHAELHRPTAFTRYNAANGIVYIDCESTENWPNTHVARYYGLETVIGK